MAVRAPRRVYLDYHATTPCDPRVLAAMRPFFADRFANPSSDIHAAGRLAREAVEKARQQIASAISAKPEEVIFTSGATESNNLAILGSAKAASSSRRRVVTSATEHKSVLDPCRCLAKEGYEIIVLPVDRLGRVDLTRLAEAIDDQTLLVSIQAANNEIGTLQPVTEVAQIVHRRGAIFHCDAAQAVGKVPADVSVWRADLLSFSAHKVYGPKGIGALFVRGGTEAASLSPLLYGGGQEWGLRPGTLNVPGIVGFGEACHVASQELADEAVRASRLRDMLESELSRTVAGLGKNGDLANRLPGNSSLTFPGVDADVLIGFAPRLMVSTGSACASMSPEPSHVLTAIGLSQEEAYGTLRIGLGRFTTIADIETAAKDLAQAYARALRSVL